MGLRNILYHYYENNYDVSNFFYQVRYDLMKISCVIYLYILHILITIWLLFINLSTFEHTFNSILYSFELNVCIRTYYTFLNIFFFTEYYVQFVKDFALLVSLFLLILK